MSKEQALPQVNVVAQHPFTLFKQRLTCVYDKWGRGYVPLRQACVELGLDPDSQQAFIEQHLVLSEDLCQGTVNGEDVVLLTMGSLALWLALLPKEVVIHTNHIADLTVLQRAAAFALQEALTLGHLTDVSMAGWLAKGDVASAIVYRQGLKLALMAREHLRLTPTWNQPLPDSLPFR